MRSTMKRLGGMWVKGRQKEEMLCREKIKQQKCQVLACVLFYAAFAQTEQADIKVDGTDLSST